ncbi:MAG: hypothetical protein KUA43_05590 [Hoeflea sp.]|uniref:hypothetical protein n=1 Tax=Hoeflea sp. TaxID=1940281 RepID=UPI001DB69E8C|nr:hypothetical protein [Hoeflea sp.]MBU4531005.1 hypothetical protein [Alphaproteobacteria bacterium]MBU4542780.1 hypothetical protein [Alphaproteobacteria bacterium]MBU4552592.1 hypothetical protein [Alphaproteobacteria bacterium]MBV1722897.1 hypothetical protein [Hoeflea sp.]MBV1762808.1 hypothetical protein [Hoeflea sp.]
MMQISTHTSAVRYIDNLQLQRDLEVQKQAHFASQRGPSYFLSHGLDSSRRELAASGNITPLIVSKSEVARLSALKLAAEADKASAAIAKVLTPHGLKVVRGDRTVTQPFANRRLVHLCETMVCYVPYATNEGNGRLVVKMTNFASGVAVPTSDGIHYRDVVPMQDTSAERNAFRVLGVLTDAEGQVVGIDQRFTTKGIAWSVGSLKAVTDACKRRAMR